MKTKTNKTIVQSYWSRPYSLMNNFGWHDRVSHFMCWTLSALKLRQFYNDVKLVTDTEGAKLLIDKLHLPYTEIDCSLDQLRSDDSFFWNKGKFIAYKNQEKSFIHVDGDFLIWDSFPTRIEEAELFAQNIEIGYSFNSELINDLQNLHCAFPQDVSTSIPINECNTGIVGGKNIDFFQFYVDYALWFYKSNRDKILMLPHGPSTATTIVEQYMFYELSKSRGIDIEYLFNDVSENSLYKLNMYYKLPQKNKYIHCIGKFKKIPLNGDRIAKILYNEFPAFYENIISMSFENKI